MQLPKQEIMQQNAVSTLTFSLRPPRLLSISGRLVQQKCGSKQSESARGALQLRIAQYAYRLLDCAYWRQWDGTVATPYGIEALTQLLPEPYE